MTRRFIPADRRALWRDLQAERRTARNLGAPTLTHVAMERGASRVVAWVASDVARVEATVTIAGIDGLWRVTAVYETRPTETPEDGATVCLVSG